MAQHSESLFGTKALISIAADRVGDCRLALGTRWSLSGNISEFEKAIWPKVMPLPGVRPH